MSLLKPGNRALKMGQPFSFSAPESAPLDAESGMAPTTTINGSGDGASDGSDNSLAASAKPSGVTKQAELLDRIAKLEADLAQSAKDAESAEKAAYTKGEKQGRIAAHKETQEHLTALQKGLEDAQAQFTVHLDQQCEAAIAIARAIVGNVLGSEDALPDQVVQTALRWKNEISQSSLVRLHVSALDFSEDDQLAPLGKAFRGVEIARDANLEKGACLFELNLGQLDASIPIQRVNAEAFLDRLASDGAGA